MLDLSNTPDEIRRDAAAILREMRQQFPKQLPDLITDPEEEPDDHH